VNWPGRQALSLEWTQGPWVEPGDPTARLRSQLYHLFSLVGAAVFLGVFALRLWRGQYLTAGIDLASAAGLLLGLMGLRWHRRLDTAMSVGLGVVVASVVGLLLLKQTAPSIFLWGYVIPPVAVHLLGLRRGMGWTAGFITVMSLLMLGGWAPGLSEQPHFPVRYAFTLTVVGLLSALFERSRAGSQARLEAALVELRAARDEAQAATRLKSEFLANMSHEIRTPMNGILGLTDMVLEAGLPEGQRARVELMRGQAQLLLRLINDILDLSKVEAGKLVLEQAGFALEPVLRQTAEFHRAQAVQRGLSFEVNLEGLTGVVVQGDELRLRQVLNNLLGNALKFTAQGGVTLRATATPAPSGLRLRCEVEDTGIGIPAAQQPRVFEKFSQADGSTTRLFGGTGLGLAICRQLVGLMGGQLSFVSTAGVGSCFSFEVPLAPGVLPTAVPVVATVPGARGRVLLVDDNSVNRLVARHLLEKLGFEVDLAEDGQEALERFVPGVHHLVFMDCQMPRVDGFTATRALRERGLEPAPVIIAMTANAMEGDRERCLAAGMNDYLTKPIAPEALRQVVAQWA
jgi:signal transduction histidine kinase